jgi:hypothetical protein
MRKDDDDDLAPDENGLLNRGTSMFDDLGGRGVDLADQIDNIRIALAMRE